MRWWWGRRRPNFRLTFLFKEKRFKQSHNNTWFFLFKNGGTWMVMKMAHKRVLCLKQCVVWIERKTKARKEEETLPLHPFLITSHHSFSVFFHPIPIILLTFKECLVCVYSVYMHVCTKGYFSSVWNYFILIIRQDNGFMEGLRCFCELFCSSRNNGLHKMRKNGF